MQPSTILDDIYNQLVTVLENVADPTNTGSKLFQNSDNSWNIFDGPQTDYKGTPAAVLIPLPGPESVFETNYMNKRGYGYGVLIVMDTEVTNYSSTRKNMRLIVDGVLDALDRSNMLSGTVDILKATSLKWTEEESALGVSIVAPLEISAVKLIQASLTS